MKHFKFGIINDINKSLVQTYCLELPECFELLLLLPLLLERLPELPELPEFPELPDLFWEALLLAELDLPDVPCESYLLSWLLDPLFLWLLFILLFWLFACVFLLLLFISVFFIILSSRIIFLEFFGIRESKYHYILFNYIKMYLFNYTVCIYFVLSLFMIDNI